MESGSFFKPSFSPPLIGQGSRWRRACSASILMAGERTLYKIRRNQAVGAPKAEERQAGASGFSGNGRLSTIRPPAQCRLPPSVGSKLDVH
jgi:hypothetical protein